MKTAKATQRKTDKATRKVQQQAKKLKHKKAQNKKGQGKKGCKKGRKKQTRVKKTKQLLPFLDLTLDAVFKVFLKHSQSLCILFLTCFLPELGKRKIRKVQFVDTEVGSDTPKAKQPRLDTLVELDNNELINVEIQCFFQSFFGARALYYWALSYIRRFKKGDKYETLRPTYLILLTDFDLLPQLKHLCASFSIRCNEQNEIVFSDHLKIVVVNLKRLGKLKLADVLKLDKGHKMGYFIKQACKLTIDDLASFTHEDKSMSHFSVDFVKVHPRFRPLYL